MSLDDWAGEKWLKENDDEYEGEYERREVPWGSAEAIAHLLDRSLDPHRIHGPRGRVIVAADTRDCLQCQEIYAPKTTWQKYCSGACRLAAFKVRRKGNAS